VATVIDDATLFAVLTRQAASSLLELVNAGEVLTTSSWYYRLHRAIHDPISPGSLSRIAANLPPADWDGLLVALDDLPPETVVPGPRLVVPIMGALRLRRRVNHLTAKALAVAKLCGGGIRVTAEAPLLRESCVELGVRLEVLPPFA
jgi:hypothetical protein